MLNYITKLIAESVSAGIFFFHFMRPILKPKKHDDIGERINLANYLVKHQY